MFSYDHDTTSIADNSGWKHCDTDRYGKWIVSTDVSVVSRCGGDYDHASWDKFSFLHNTCSECYDDLLGAGE